MSKDKQSKDPAVQGKEIKTAADLKQDGKVQGMAIVMRGKHLCKTMRGVRNDGMMTVAHLSGVFKTNADARAEFYRLIDEKTHF